MGPPRVCPFSKLWGRHCLTSSPAGLLQGLPSASPKCSHASSKIDYKVIKYGIRSVGWSPKGAGGTQAVPSRTSVTGSELFIVDNSDEDWKVLRYLHDWCQISKAIDCATGHFEIGAILALKDEWQKVDQLRILMGNEVSPRTRDAFLESVKDRPGAVIKVNGPRRQVTPSGTCLTSPPRRSGTIRRRPSSSSARSRIRHASTISRTTLCLKSALGWRSTSKIPT
jgi:hypothetical protein